MWFEIAKNIKPSHRGELEITTVNQVYLERGDLKVELMVEVTPAGYRHPWIVAGSVQFIQTIEKRQGLKVACIEEIGLWDGLYFQGQLIHAGQPLLKNQYGQYLLRRAGEGVASAMNFIKTAIADIIIIEPMVFGDERGYFIETFRQHKLDAFLGFKVNLFRIMNQSPVMGTKRSALSAGTGLTTKTGTGYQRQSTGCGGGY